MCKSMHTWLDTTFLGESHWVAILEFGLGDTKIKFCQRLLYLYQWCWWYPSRDPALNTNWLTDIHFQLLSRSHKVPDLYAVLLSDMRRISGVGVAWWKIRRSAGKKCCHALLSSMCAFLCLLYRVVSVGRTVRYPSDGLVDRWLCWSAMQCCRIVVWKRCSGPGRESWILPFGLLKECVNSRLQLSVL
jgi:hypothetical protein